MAQPQIQTPAMDEPHADAGPSDGHNMASGLASDNKAEAESGASGSTKKCTHCNKVDSDPEKPFKPCSKCQTALYCSRDCQKANWKQHKKTCAASAQIYAQTADLKPTPPPRVSKKEGHRGGLQKWQFDT